MAKRVRESMIKQNMLTLIAKVLGDCGGICRAMQPQQRRRVGRRCDHHRARERLGGQDVFHELAHFAPTLADQSDHDDIGRRIARHHAEQHALAHAAAGEQAQALAASDREQRVDRTHADVEDFADRLALERIEGTAVQRNIPIEQQRAAVIERAAGTVYHAYPAMPDQPAPAWRDPLHDDVGRSLPPGAARA